jgi:hypothetical protein
VLRLRRRGGLLGRRGGRHRCLLGELGTGLYRACELGDLIELGRTMICYNDDVGVGDEMRGSLCAGNRSRGCSDYCCFFCVRFGPRMDGKTHWVEE